MAKGCWVVALDDFVWNVQFRLRVGGVCLDLEPDAEPSFGRSDRGHFRPCVTRDHGNGLRILTLYVLGVYSERGSDNFNT